MRRVAGTDPRVSSVACRATNVTRRVLCRSVSFKGGKGEDAVLCTATDTYSVCRVQTSNTCLLANMSHGSTAPDAAASAGAGGGAGAGSGGVVTPDGGGDEAAGDGAGTTGKPTFLVTSSVSSQHNVRRRAPCVREGGRAQCSPLLALPLLLSVTGGEDCATAAQDQGAA